jgi:sugar phosphate isomerase/epimerase
MLLGLVTYNWGKDWDLPTLLKNLQDTQFGGVELRTTHKHGVEPALSAAERRDVARRFQDAGIELVGLGTASEYHSPDPAVLQKNIDESKAFIQLCHDVGGTGVKVRPNGLPPDVPEAKTLEQIGGALDQLARFGAGYGVEIRLEVHGKGTSLLPNVKRILNAAPHPGVKVCWNCNADDLSGEGLEANFRLVQERIGTVHIHDLTSDYPWRPLFGLLKASGFEGWTLLEEGAATADPIRVMKYYRLLWEEWLKDA